MATKISETTLRQVLEIVTKEQHWSARMVAARIGKTHTTAAAALKMLGLARPPGRPRTDLDAVRRAVEAAIAANGGRRPPLWRLARMTGFSEHAIRRALREAARAAQGGGGHGTGA